MNMYEKDFLYKLYISVNKMIENQALILFLLDQTTHHAFNHMVEEQLKSTMDMFCPADVKKKDDKKIWYSSSDISKMFEEFGL